MGWYFRNPQSAWDLSYWLPAWLVGPVLLIGAILIVAAVLQIGLPWYRQWRRRPKPGSQQDDTAMPAPTSRRKQRSAVSAASTGSLERLQDDVARQSLQKERERVARELERGDLVVVVFGTGSSGKTSLIRALLRDIVGDVGAAMGSTSESQRYRLRLRGLTGACNWSTPQGSWNQAWMDAAGNRKPASTPVGRT